MERNTQRLRVLLVSICLLAAAIFFKSKLPALTNANSQLAFPKLNRDNITAIDVQETNDTIFLKKINSRWFVKKDGENFAADGDRINSIINSLETLKIRGIVSDNKNNRADFGIGKQAITLHGKNDYILYLGDSNASNQYYVRIGKSNAVFTAGNLDDILIPADYRDLSTHLVDDENKVKNIKIDYSGKETVLVKNNDQWKVNNVDAQREQADYYINDLKTLKSTDIFLKNPVDSSMTASLTITVDGKTATFYEKDKDNYYLSISGDKKYYQIPAVYVSSLMKEQKDFTK